MQLLGIGRSEVVEPRGTGVSVERSNDELEKEIDKLLSKNIDLIKALNQTVMVRRDEFERYYLALIRRVAGYVYTVPVSRKFYSGYSDMFRLCLDSAYFAYRDASAAVFAAGEDPDIRREKQQIWPYAVFVGALCYPLGMMCSELVVRNRNSGDKWNPLCTGYLNWSRKMDEEDIEITWDYAKTIHDHGVFSLAISRKIIPEYVDERLDLAGDDVVEKLCHALVGKDKSEIHLSGSIIKNACESAIDKDVRENKGNGIRVDGLTVGYYILDALRIYHKSKWRINSPEYPIWNLSEGLFIWWEKAAPVVLEHLKEEGLTQLPQDADTLAYILVNEGLCETYKDENEGGAAYWPVTIQMQHVPSVVMRMLKFSNPGVLLGSGNHMITPAIIGEHRKESIVDENPAEETPTDFKNDMPPPPPVEDNVDMETGEILPTPASGEAMEKNAADIKNRQKELVFSDENKKAGKEGKQNKRAKTEEKSETSVAHKKIPEPGSNKNLLIYGTAGEILELISEDVAKGKWKPGVDIFWDLGGLCINTPRVVGAYGVDAKQVIEEMEMLQWLDKGSQEGYIRTYKTKKTEKRGKRFVVLTEKIGRIMTHEMGVDIPRFKAVS